MCSGVRIYLGFGVLYFESLVGPPDVQADVLFGPQSIDLRFV